MLPEPAPGLALRADQNFGTPHDKRENVHFYERHEYVVVAQADVICVPNWFMIRQPQRSE